VHQNKLLETVVQVHIERTKNIVLTHKHFSIS